MIRIALVEDHSVVRESLRMALEADGSMQVVCETSEGEAMLRQDIEVDVVIMDVNLPGLSGVETTRLLLHAHPKARVLALSGHLDREAVQRMLNAGARGYMSKSSGYAELKTAIRSVMEGRTYLCPDTAAVLGDAFRETDEAAELGTGKAMSEREVEVLRLLARGPPPRQSAPNSTSRRTRSTCTGATSWPSSGCTAWSNCPATRSAPG